MSKGRRERTCGDARGAVVSACLPMSNGRAVRPFRRAGALMREAISMMRELGGKSREHVRARHVLPVLANVIWVRLCNLGSFFDCAYTVVPTCSSAALWEARVEETRFMLLVC